MKDERKTKRELIGELLELRRKISEFTTLSNTIATTTKKQATIARLGQQALEGRDPAELMDEAVMLAAQNLEVEYCSILEFNPDNKEFLLRTGVGWPKELIGKAAIELDPTFPIAYTLYSSKPIIIKKIELNSRAGLSPFLNEINGGSGICTSIKGLERPYGILSVFTKKKRRFVLRQANFLQALANIIATATERKIYEESCSLLLERLMTAQEEERKSIARELHDDIGQALTSLLVGLRLLDRLKTMAEVKDKAEELRKVNIEIMNNLKRLARGLHPRILEDLGLIVALSRYTDDFARQHNIVVNLDTKGLKESMLPSRVKITLYRIVQEALTNIVSHSLASTVKIILKSRPAGLQLVIIDNGTGFDVEKVLRDSISSNHLGLHSMRERASLLGGSFAIKSKPGEGTTITVRIPLQNV